MNTEMLRRQADEEQQPTDTGQASSQPAPRGLRSQVAAEGRRALIPLVAGLLGSLAAILVMSLLRVTVGAPTLPELLGERVLPLLSAETFVALLARFQPHSKTTPLGLTLLGQFVLGIVLGPAIAKASASQQRPRRFWPGRRAWAVAGGVVALMEGLGLALFWPVLASGLAGDPLSTARLITSLTMLATFVAFALVVTLANHWLHLAWSARPRSQTPGQEAPQPPEAAGEIEPSSRANRAAGGQRAISRRTALGGVGVVVLGVAAGGLGIDRVIAAYFARSNLAYEGMETGDLTPITPNQHFYVVSKNVLDPEVDVGRWQLEVAGLVNQPKTWNYAQVRSLPSETRVVTFECIANTVGGHLISTAEWQGVLLQTVLNAAGGAQPGGKYVIFTSVDDYQYSLALADLLEARAFLAWQMNGEPLPNHHGFPLRVVVPGRYGEQSPKWLTRIEVVDQLYTGGLYQSQGWSSAQLHTMSRIDQPSAKVARGAISVAGIAFAGIRGIGRVEVSADAGKTWQNAALLPPLSDQSWVFWQWLWVPPGPGTYTLLARATDGTGAVQTERQQGTVPAGATGWPRVTVQVA